MGLWSTETYGSIACTKASIPVAAVMAWGIPNINIGSLKETNGMFRQETTTNFKWVSSLLITAWRVNSEPVPAVVLTAISGGRGLLKVSIPANLVMSSPLVRIIPIPFPQSWEEPPPTVMIESHPWAKYSSLPALMLRIFGFGSTPSKTT